jgi:hypothetical protein
MTDSLPHRLDLSTLLATAEGAPAVTSINGRSRGAKPDESVETLCTWKECVRRQAHLGRHPETLESQLPASAPPVEGTEAPHPGLGERGGTCSYHTGPGSGRPSDAPGTPFSAPDKHLAKPSLGAVNLPSEAAQRALTAAPQRRIVVPPT